jgi:hypothetical protein
MRDVLREAKTSRHEFLVQEFIAGTAVAAPGGVMFLQITKKIGRFHVLHDGFC